MIILRGHLPRRFRGRPLRSSAPAEAAAPSAALGEGQAADGRGGCWGQTWCPRHPKFTHTPTHIYIYIYIWGYMGIIIRYIWFYLYLSISISIFVSISISISIYIWF